MSASVDEQVIRARSIALLQYLRELVLLRTTSVKTVDSYERVLWLDELPKHKNITTDYTPSGDPGQVWLRVVKPKVKPRPVPPVILRDWLDEDELDDPGAKEPQLGLTIAGPGEDSEALGELEDEKAVEATEPPDEIFEAYCEYIDSAWRPWAQAVASDKAVENVYRALFTMYQRQEKLGEAYEIIVGLGLLTWKSAPKTDVRRHLVVAKASLTFDAAKGAVAIGPGPNGPELAIEEDMIEAKARPGAKEQESLRGALAACGDAVWDIEAMSATLNQYAHGMVPSGVYDDAWAKPGPSSEEAIVSFSPALILRARPQKSILQFLQAAAEQLEAGAPVPFGIERLVTTGASKVGADQRENESYEGSEEDEEVYMPLPANEEQLRVVEALRKAEGVLVQGPPGTGKSHTIANLICHLLAKGKRVLVTSHTERALKVLKGLLPKEMQSLCVQLVGTDTTGLKGLEHSVEGISHRHADWDPGTSEDVVRKLRVKRKFLAAKEMKLLADLMASRELASYEVTAKFGVYSGTPQAMAERIAAETEEFGWLADFPGDEDLVPITNMQALSMLAWLRANNDESAIERALESTFEIEGLPDADVLRALLAERAPILIQLESQNAEPHPYAAALEAAETGDRTTLIETLTDLLTHVESLDRRILSWAKIASRDILAEQDRKWRVLVEHTGAVLGRVRATVAKVDETTVTGAEKQDARKLTAECDILLQWIRAKGKIGLFGPKEVRTAKNAVGSILVNGRKCADAKTIQDLKDWAEVTDAMSSLAREWEGIANPPTSQSYKFQVAEYEDFCEPIVAALSLHEHLPVLRRIVVERMGQSEIAWHDLGELQGLLYEAQRAQTKTSLARLNSHLEELKKFVGDLADRYVSVGCLRDAANAADLYDIDAYRTAYEAVKDRYGEVRSEAEAARSLLAIRGSAPNLSSDLVGTAMEPMWDRRLARLDQAWQWAQARTWLARIVSPGESDRLWIDLRRCRDDIASNNASLAAELAWSHTMERMTADQSEHLKNWSRCIAKMPKNTGKRTAQLRIDARRSMDNCRTAIPAWIMPAHRVAESVSPGGEIFDVVITDEASQSGIEELFLNYISDQIIVVGDDKQISPPAFTAAESVAALRDRFLSDIPMPEMFDPHENSVFHAAKVKFGVSVQLREHFRCMPEIIEFSNQLCYSKGPLIPLKRFGSGRLEPVIRLERVEGAKAVGRTNKINKAEAEALIETLCRCIDRPEYEGKSFGVISLLGAGQAAYIERQLLGRIGESEFQTRRLVCGDAYAFQGDERDIMFLSMVAAPSDGAERVGYMVKEDDERRFNVAMSRAKEQVWLFHSVDAGFFHANDVRRKLLGYCANPWSAAGGGEVDVHELRRVREARLPAQTPPPPFQSWLEVDICFRIAERGFQVIPQFEVHGKRIDLVVQGTSSGVAVECDGDIWHGPDQWQADSDRQCDLERCGWVFKRILGSHFYLDPDAALDGLWHLLDTKNIRPKGWQLCEPDSDTALPDQVQSEGYVGETILPDDEAPAPVSESPPPTYLAPRRQVWSDSYTCWRGVSVPDPRYATVEAIAAAVLSIVEAEGPVCWKRVLSAYRESWSLSRLKGSTRDNVRRACRWLVNREQVLEEVEKGIDDWELRVARLPGTPRAIVRPSGPRDFEEVPPSEIAMRMISMGYPDTGMVPDWYFTAVLRVYGSRRGGQVRAHLDDAKALADEPLFRQVTQA